MISRVTERASFLPRAVGDVLQHGIQLGEDRSPVPNGPPRPRLRVFWHGQQGQDTHAVYVPLVKRSSGRLECRQPPDGSDPAMVKAIGGPCCGPPTWREKKFSSAPHGVLVGIPGPAKVSSAIESSNDSTRVDEGLEIGHHCKWRFHWLVRITCSHGLRQFRCPDSRRVARKGVMAAIVSPGPRLPGDRKQEVPYRAAYRPDTVCTASQFNS